VNTSLLEALVGVLSWSAGMFFESGHPPPPAGNHHPLAAPYGVFQARDRAFNIACGNERQWRQLCAVMDSPELAEDERFADPLARLSNRPALHEALNTRLARRDADAWIARLNESGVPSGPIYDMAEVFADPQVQARGMYVELPDEHRGVFKTTGIPVKLSASPGDVRRAPPRLGADTDAVLATIGLSGAEIERLRRAGVV
jgi:crotonobetainyl-CoA:carnitine CoA-transferase CaiB-like acyl-CoA transferase